MILMSINSENLIDIPMGAKRYTRISDDGMKLVSSIVFGVSLFFGCLAKFGSGSG